MKKKLRTNFLVSKLNNISLGKKLMVMQIFCVLIPLLLTDSVILGLIVNSEKKESLQEMNKIADSVKYTISDSLENARILSQNIYGNRYVNQFMETQFESNADYYDKYVEFIKDSLYTISVGGGHYNAVIYADNDNIVNGGYFKRLEEALDQKWYQEFLESNKEIMFFSDYVHTGLNSHREIALIRHMDYYQKNRGKSILKLDLDYSGISKRIVNEEYSSVLYVCDGDRILFSNDGKGGLQAPFQHMWVRNAENAGVHKTISVYDKELDIFVMKPERDSVDIIKENYYLILFLICVNIILPLVLMQLINKSFTQRIKELDLVFGNVDEGQMKQLPRVQGKDEISVLMESYNRMARRMNELIQSVYKDRLKSQEIDIARQKAELLALHSQINPHFLFNALESIRMHSVIKKEYETADMVQKLAMMERQNVEWGNDLVRIEEEVKFIEAYLELQKYRFGEKLTYEMNVDEECNKYWIPKLTLVTFVENACVHGMENKTASGWIFVRIYKELDRLVMEVEDTGSGMSEEQCKRLVDEMANVKIEMLKENKHVGILNAALRLKMATNDKVTFEMYSEVGAGTMVTVTIPVEETGQMNEQKR